MITEILNNIPTANPKFDNTPYSTWSSTPPARKGKIGEEIAKCILQEDGWTVEPREAKTHDFILNGKKTEVKTAFEAQDKDCLLYTSPSPRDS